MKRCWGLWHYQGRDWVRSPSCEPRSFESLEEAEDWATEEGLDPEGYEARRLENDHA